MNLLETPADPETQKQEEQHQKYSSDRSSDDELLRSLSTYKKIFIVLAEYFTN